MAEIMASAVRDVAAIAFGCIAAIALIGIIFWFLRRRRKAAARLETQRELGTSEHSFAYPRIPSFPFGAGRSYSFSYIGTFYVSEECLSELTDLLPSTISG